MPMTPPAAPQDRSAGTRPALPTALAALLGWFRSRAALDLAGLDREEARRIATDLNVSVDDLLKLAGQSADEAALMTRMMAAHGLDRAAIEQAYPAVCRQMAVTCASCDCKRQCAADLDAGTAAHSAPFYCPNSEPIAAFRG